MPLFYSKRFRRDLIKTAIVSEGKLVSGVAVSLATLNRCTVPTLIRDLEKSRESVSKVINNSVLGGEGESKKADEHRTTIVYF